MIIDQHAAELSLKKRDQLLPSHPVRTGNFVVLTPMMEAAYSIVRERVFQRRTGTFLHAIPQTGKSTCCNAIKLFLSQEFKNIVIVSHVASNSRTRKAADTAILKGILRSEGVSLQKARYEFDDLIHLLQTHVEMEANDKHGDQFVLLIDEMHMMSENDFITLMTLQSRLKAREISMTTIGFAQPEIMGIRELFLLKKAHQLIARFLLEPISFFGCADVRDLQVILVAYDTQMQYPAGSTVSYTKFFLPLAYEANFRLADYTNLIWNGLQAYQAPQISSSVLMVHIINTIQHLLCNYSKFDSATFEITEQMVETSVTHSGICGYNDVLGTVSH